MLKLWVSIFIQLFWLIHLHEKVCFSETSLICIQPIIQCTSRMCHKPSGTSLQCHHRHYILQYHGTRYSAVSQELFGMHTMLPSFWILLHRKSIIMNCHHCIFAWSLHLQSILLICCLFGTLIVSAFLIHLWPAAWIICTRLDIILLENDWFHKKIWRFDLLYFLPYFFNFLVCAKTKKCLSWKADATIFS